MIGKFNEIKKEKFYIITFIFLLLLFNSCATNHLQLGKETNTKIGTNNILKDQKPIHSFFLIGNTESSGSLNQNETLQILKPHLESADSASTLLFLGNNFHPKEFNKMKDSLDIIKEEKITLDINFKGNVIFIPGNDDWKNGLKSLKEQEKLIRQVVGKKKAFMPRNVCGLDDKKLNDSVALLTIDSQWFLENWDKNEKINEDCDIRTRDDFFKELEKKLNDFQNQTVIIAMHHPVLNNGRYGGQFSVADQLFPFQPKIPLPIIGSGINLIRRTSGINPQDLQNGIYRSFVNRVKTMIQDRTNTVFVSAHDNSLQYLEENNIKQIISGSSEKTDPARAINEKDFSFGGKGFVILDVYDEGNSIAKFYSVEKGTEKLIFETNVTPERKIGKDFIFDKKIPSLETSQVYSNDLTEKSKTYKFFFGEHYRYYYSLPVKAKTLDLSQFKGGVLPARSGGGHQSKTLRLIAPDGKEYVMRALKKSATKFIQALAFKEQYLEKDFENTFTEEFLLDFYTTTNPYYPFAINEFADPLGLYHTNPELYYIPKQNTLGQYNENFGDELYMVEERPMKAYNDADFFGKPNDIINTDDLILNLRRFDKYSVNEDSYIRARLFDMLIGDWDRHSDQWRWSEFKEGDKIIYEPIARDRDQVFPMYDGALISFFMRMPAFKHMQAFKEDIRDVKWFNMEPYPMDLAILKNSTLEDWLKEADFIEKTLTDEIIENSFQNLPKEVKDEKVESIKETLKVRKHNLRKFAEEYYKVLQKTIVLTGTDKDDKFIIERLANGETSVKIYREKKEADSLIFERTYSRKETKEIWIYGLNDKDEFILNGKPDQPILLRLIGGRDGDIYTLENGRKVRIYDFYDKKNKFENSNSAKTYLSNDYELNTYDYTKPKYNKFTGLPSGGFNPDDGVKLGMSFTYTENGFDRNPFTRKHNLLANYYFATGGYELTYTSTFAKFIGKWNLELQARFTSPTYSTNFFGFGNETENFQKEVGMDYNRVRLQSLRFTPSLYKNFRNNAVLRVKANLEDILVENSNERITEYSTELNPEVFHHQKFGEIGIKYTFMNYDNVSLPTVGMVVEVEGNYKSNLEDFDRSFSYFAAAFGFTQKLTKSDRLTFGTIFKGKAIVGDNFEFYQAAAIGGDNDVRAYRTGRFIGKYSFYQSSDLRLFVGNIRRFIIPMKFGFILGYDYGRVWMDEENSNKWHQSLGGGIWLNGVDTITGKISYFHGEDGGRIAVGVNFGF